MHSFVEYDTISNLKWDRSPHVLGVATKIVHVSSELSHLATAQVPNNDPYLLSKGRYYPEG